MEVILRKSAIVHKFYLRFQLRLNKALQHCRVFVVEGTLLMGAGTPDSSGRGPTLGQPKWLPIHTQTLALSTGRAPVSLHWRHPSRFFR